VNEVTKVIWGAVLAILIGLGIVQILGWLGVWGVVAGAICS